MDDEVWRRPLASYDAEQRRLAAQFEIDRKKHEQDIQRKRERLERNLSFLVMLSANGAENEHLRKVALDIAAKEYAANPLTYEDKLSRLAAFAAPKAVEQDDLERKQANERELQQERRQPRQQQVHISTRETARQPDYFARNEPGIDRNRPERQPLGKYQTLDDTTRRLREESDRQQPPVERHLQIDREVKNPDYRNTAREVSRRDTSGGIRQARDATEQQERGAERNEGRNDPGRGGRSR